jgi:hypothetical protein
MTLLFTVGLVEEDGRFGRVFEALHDAPGRTRPTLGLLSGPLGEHPEAARVSLRALEELGLIEAPDHDLPRSERVARIPAPLWDAMRGDAPASPAPGLTHRRHGELVAIDDLIVPSEVARQLAALPDALGRGTVGAVVVRGPQRSGRRTILGALAAAMQRGLLVVEAEPVSLAERWRLAGPLAALLGAMPVAAIDAGPGESVTIDQPPAEVGPVGVVLGRSGGVNGSAVTDAVEIEAELPESALRERHWHAVLDGAAGDRVEALAQRYRMTGGNVRRAARLALASAAADGREQVTAGDVAKARGALHREALETVAAPVRVAGSWDELAVGEQTMAELALLETRCRHRERLGSAAGAPVGERTGAGVRALFSGPSGTGKTLAAGLLSSVLGLDLYRLDLSTVVNKYLGETEKNLARVFSRAEELDVVLLLDEGDALMTRRTSVHTSNDRYANLETNFLLQRLEAFEGILVVTTNAGERIDGAFQRRMDVVVEFRPPGPLERWSIWELHLPGGHRVDGSMLQEVAARCSMTGAQIRNAALHASLLALDDGGTVLTEHALEAVRREYRKSGQLCPLAPAAHA